MGTVADAQSAGQTATAAKRASSTPRAGIDADRATAGPSSIATDSCTAGDGARFQLQLFRAGVEHALDGPGAGPELLRRAAIRTGRMLVLQRATGAAARVDSAAVDQRPSGIRGGITPASGIRIAERREGGEPDTARNVELLDGSAAPGVPDLHVRLARFNVNKNLTKARFRQIFPIEHHALSSWIPQSFARSAGPDYRVDWIFFWPAGHA